MRRIAYFKPVTMGEAWELKSKYPRALFISGGTDLLVKIKNREIAPPALISLRNISGLRAIGMNGSMRIGSAVTIAEILKNPTVAGTFPILSQAGLRLGSVQIRNTATLGGNLSNCSPCADTALPLLVLEARVELKSPSETREIPVSEFFLGPGKSCLKSEEILTAVIIDPPSANARGAFLKKGRVMMDLAVASLSVLLWKNGDGHIKVRAAAGSVAPTPLRLHDVEKFLEKKGLSADNISKAAAIARKSISPITDLRASADYRRHLIGVYLRRVLEALGTQN